MAITTGSDRLFVESLGTLYVGLGDGDDLYVIDSTNTGPNSKITISDSGVNRVQLTSGLTIKSSSVASNTTVLILSNGAEITISNAAAYSYIIGGIPGTGIGGTTQTYTQFATTTLGVTAVPAVGATSVAGTVKEIPPTGAVIPPSAVYTLASSAFSVSEGNAVTFTVTATTAPTVATTLNYQVIGSAVSTSVSAAAAADFSAIIGSVKIAAGATTGTFTVTPSSDGVVEGYEGFNVVLLDSSYTTVATSGNVVIADADAATVTGQTSTLTTGVDTKVGTSADDIFSGYIDAGNASVTTLNSGDNLDGGAGTDALNVTLTGTAGTTSVAGVTLKNIERVQVQNVSSATQTINLSTSTGYSTLSTFGSSTAVTFSNVKSIPTAEMSNGTSNLTLGLASTIVSGSSDSITLHLNNQASGIFTTGTGVETVIVNATDAASTLTLAGADSHTAVNVTGDQALTLDVDDSGNTITTIDTSANTGGVTLSGIGTAVTSIVGGSGNDSVTIAASTISSTITINGGDGIDTLVLDGSVTASAAAKVSNFETVKFANAALGGTLTQDASAFATAKISVAGINDQNATFTNLGATQGITITAAQAETVQTSLKTDTNADTTSVTLGTSTTAAGTVNAVTVNNAETLNLTSLGGLNTITTLTDSSATKLNITATKALTIGTLTASALKTIDATSSVAAVTLTAGQAMTITGGTGNDSLTGSSGADNINSGAGNNTIIGGGGNDTLTGGTGNDSIRGGAGNDVITTGDGTNTVDIATVTGGTHKVTGGAGVDTIKITFGDLGTSGTQTIIGGDGSDVLELTNDVTMNFATDPTILNNISSVESFKFSGISGKTVTVNDGVVSVAGGTLTLSDTADNASNVFDASAVLASASKVVFDASTLVTNAVTYYLGNGIDQATGGAGADIFRASSNVFLSSTDTIVGGSGSDTLLLTNTTGSTVTASQFTNVSGVETFGITTGGAGNYIAALTDAWVSPNASSLGVYTVTRSTTDTGTTKIDGSAVSSTFALALNGGARADTLIGGSGADTITGNAGIDSLTGGAGNDTFYFDAVTGTAATGSTDIITDFNFGTSTTSVDIIKVDGTWSAAGLYNASSGEVVADYTIIVLDTASYADLAAAEDAAAALHTANATDYLFLWQDGLGTTHISFDGAQTTDSGGTEAVSATVGLLDLAKLPGVSITGVSSLINAGDFLLV